MPLTREEILERMETGEWIWADKDRNALDELEFRAIRAARNRGFLTYSELAEGVDFNLPNYNGGRPYRIDTKNWKDSDRALIGDFLGKISTRSFREHGFMLSAVAVGKDPPIPSPHFFQWMQRLGILDDLSDESTLPFWRDQYEAAFDHYANR